MSYVIQIETTTQPHPLAVIRRRAAVHELSKIIPETCGTVWSALRTQNIKGGRLVAIYLDKLNDQINLEIGAEVDTPITAVGELIPSSLPTGRIATTTHFGPYHKLSEAHQALRNGCRQNNQTPAGPTWEIYGHWQPDWNQNPSQIRTDIYYLIK